MRSRRKPPHFPRMSCRPPLKLPWPLQTCRHRRRCAAGEASPGLVGWKKDPRSGRGNAAPRDTCLRHGSDRGSSRSRRKSERTARPVAHRGVRPPNRRGSLHRHIGREQKGLGNTKKHADASRRLAATLAGGVRLGGALGQNRGGCRSLHHVVVPSPDDGQSHIVGLSRAKGQRPHVQQRIM